MSGRAVTAPDRSLRARLLAVVLTASLLVAASPAPSVALTSAASSAPVTVSVRDYGAKGNGIADDSAAIQRAMDVQGGKTVVFPAGTYRFARIAVRDHTAIVFQPGARGVIVPRAGDRYQRFFAVFGTSTARAGDVSITGGSFTGDGNTVAVMWIAYADRVTVTGVASDKVVSNVDAVSSTQLTVRGCSASHGTYGYFFSICSHVTVERCFASNMRRDGITFYDRSQYVTATANTVQDYTLGGEVGRAGIQMYGSSDGTITGNTVLNGHNDPVGIRFRDSDRFWCADNYVVNPSGRGFAVDRVGDFPPLQGGDGTFIRNTVVGAHRVGIDLSASGSKPSRLVDNLVRHTTNRPGDPYEAVGIRLLTPKSVAIGNDVEFSDGIGIRVGASDILVARNVVHDPLMSTTGPKNAIWIDGVRERIVENTVRDDLRHLYDGIYLDTKGSALIRGNVVSGQARYAVRALGTLLPSVQNDALPPGVGFASTPSGTGITLTARDGSSGAAGISYSIDGDRVLTSPGPYLAVSADTSGTHTIRYSALDAAGNASPYEQRAFTVPAQPARTTEGATVMRLYGASRIDTAVQASRTAFPLGADTVVVVTSSDWPDGMAAGSLSAAYHAPLLLTSGTALSAAVKTEIDRLRAARVIIVSTGSAISSGVQASLEQQVGKAGVTRIGGADRYATAMNAAKAAVAKLRTTAGWDGTVFVTTGKGFPDALAASPLSAARGWPILFAQLDSAGSLTSGMASFVRTTLGAKRAVILGGPTSVPPAVESRLGGLLGTGAVSRLGGHNRWETAAMAAGLGTGEGGLAWDRVAVVNGYKFPDALSAGPLQARSRSVLLLTDPSVLSTPTAGELQTQRDGVRSARVLGGTPSVSAAVFSAIGAALK